MRKLNLILVLLALVFLSIPTQAAIKKGPYLIYEGTNTEMTVLWQLDATTTCTLEWGLDTNYSTGDVQTSEYGSDHQHKHVISSLSVGTKYFYRVTEGSNTYTGSFTTAPAESATAVKLLAWGDSRSQPAEMDGVAENMVATYTADPAYQTIALHSGDWVGADSESSWTNEFLNRSYANSLELLANVPMQGSRGNHEGGGNVYRKYYPYPYEANHYFSFDYGPVHVVVIDQYTTYTSGSAQYNWLVNDLQNTCKPWKIAVYHHPAWSAGYHGNNGTAQTHLHPLFVQYNVPLIINGHNHYYARCLVDGIHHITAGGAGAPLYRGSSNDPYVVEYAKTYHHCEIEIDVSNVLTFTAVNSKGSTIDTFQIVGDTDFTPPSPDPMTWATLPYETGANSIAMVATTATDSENGVEYKFTCTTSGGHDSDWQTGTSYEDTNVPGGTQQTYTVTARDTSDNHNVTAASTAESATTDPEYNPPTPDPMTWATVPYATSGTSIAMLATTASDPSGVEYYFTCTAGGGNDSGWQDSSTYEDTGLSAKTLYTYTVTASDKSSAQNNTAASSPASATTPSGTNVVLPANGGVLEDFTSEYGGGWVATDLTNGVTSEDGWCSKANPAPYQEFIYSFDSGNPANLDLAIIHGGTAEGMYYSKDVEVWTSSDGENYALKGSDTLLNQTNDSVAIDLGGVYAEKVKLMVTSGYRTDYWELSEFEVFGEITGGCTPTDMHIEAVVCSEVPCGGPNRNGQATVTIYDDCGDPVTDALVDGTFTGDFSESFYDVATDGNGQAVFTTVGCIKKPSYTFTVTDVTDSLPYDSNDDVTDNCSG